MALTGDQYQKLTEAFVDAFQTLDELDQMVRFSFIGKPLAAIAMGDNLQSIVFKLIKWTESRDKTDELVVDARNVNPSNKALKEFAKDVGALENIVIKSAAFEDPEEWRSVMSRRELAICRIEIPADTGIGTGFLVNSNILMTNYHVMKSVIEKSVEPTKVALRFNYKTEADGVTMQKADVFKLADDWLVDSSPVAELDYALLRVADDPGLKKDGDQQDAKARGWLALEGHGFENGEPLFILQHPDAGPLKLAPGFVKDVEDNRVIYTVNTLPGSSGSPCFTTAWQPVALHHYGAGKGNRGVTFSAILDQLNKRNLTSMLGH